MGILTNVLSAWEGWNDYKDRQKKSQVENASKIAELYHEMNPSAAAYPTPISNQLNQAMGLGQQSSSGGGAGILGGLQKLFGGAGGQQGQAQVQPEQSQNIQIPQQKFQVFDPSSGTMGPVNTVMPGVKMIQGKAPEYKGITNLIDPGGKLPPTQTWIGDPQQRQKYAQGYQPENWAASQARLKETQANQEQNRAQQKQLHDDTIANRPTASKAPLPETDKGWTVRVGQSGVNEASKIVNGQVVTEPYDPAKHGQMQARNQAPLAAGMVDNPDPALTGADALKNYIPQVQTRATKLLKGEVPYPPGYLQARDPLWRAAIDAAQAVDPSWNAQKYQITQAIRKSFTSGKDAQNKTSINTLVDHFAHLAKSAQGLGNYSNQWLNGIGNWIETVRGDPKVTRFNMDLGAVESELAAVFKSTGATDQEIKAWSSRISSSQSPRQLEENIKEGISLMGGRLKALRDKYQSGMGIFANDLQILSPRSRKILEGIIGKDAVNELEPPKPPKPNSIAQRGQEKKQAQSSQPQLPAEVLSKIPEGKYATYNGDVWQMKNGKPKYIGKAAQGAMGGTQ